MAPVAHGPERTAGGHGYEAFAAVAQTLIDGTAVSGMPFGDGADRNGHRSLMRWYLVLDFLYSRAW